MARVTGLTQLPPAKYHPFELDTEGLGAVFDAAVEKGAEQCLVGIGGSATNDGGFGMARSLGWQFFGTHDKKIVRWTELRALAQVRPPDRPQLFKEIIVAVDVQNPLLGPQGCTRIYGPQKGLRPDDFKFTERCLEQMATIISKELHLDYANEPGAGAAGGLGYGLRCFAGARLEPGFALFARYSKLAECLKSAHLVITGEGAIDSSSLMGKGVGEVARLCQTHNVPCIGIAGMVSELEPANSLFAGLHALAPGFATPEEAKSQPAIWLERLAAKLASEWKR
jgi:glycerate kinase